MSTTPGMDYWRSAWYSKHMNKAEFGERLRAIRMGRLIRSGPEIGVRELARRTGISNSTISQIETGKAGDGKLPSYDDVRGLARGLGVTIAHLVGEDDTPVPPPDPETERLAELARGVLRLVRGSVRPSPESVAAYHRERLRRELPPEVFAVVERAFVETEAAYERMVGLAPDDDPADEPTAPEVGREA